MKNIKRILSLVFSLSVSLLTMSVGVSSSAMSNFDNSTSDMEYLYDNDRNSYSIELFKNFISSCPSNNVGSVETTDFPDNYGGAYIDEKNVLHIKVVDSVDDGFTLKNSTNIADIKKNIGAVDVNNDVIIEEAEVSLEEMLEIQKTLDSVMVDFDISSTYTDEEKNVLGISLLDISKKDDIITYLKKNINNFNSNSVLFEQGEAISLSASDTSNNALAGSESSSSDGWATLGFNAYNSSSGKYGVVTAAHFATSGTTIYNSVGTTIGKPSVRQFSGTLDAAFVPFGSSISPSKYISQLSSPNDKLTGYYSNSSIVQGMTTTKVGGYLVSQQEQLPMQVYLFLIII